MSHEVTRRLQVIGRCHKATGVDEERLRCGRHKPTEALGDTALPLVAKRRGLVCTEHTFVTVHRFDSHRQRTPRPLAIRGQFTDNLISLVSSTFVHAGSPLLYMLGSLMRLYDLRFGAPRLWFRRPPFGSRFASPNSPYAVTYFGQSPEDLFLELGSAHRGLPMDHSRLGIARVSLTRPLKLVDLRTSNAARMSLAESQDLGLAIWQSSETDGILFRSQSGAETITLFERAQDSLGRWSGLPVIGTTTLLSSIEQKATDLDRPDADLGLLQQHLRVLALLQNRPFLDSGAAPTDPTERDVVKVAGTMVEFDSAIGKMPYSPQDFERIESKLDRLLLSSSRQFEALAFRLDEMQGGLDRIEIATRHMTQLVSWIDANINVLYDAYAQEALRNNFERLKEKAPTAFRMLMSLLGHASKS